MRGGVFLFVCGTHCGSSNLVSPEENTAPGDTVGSPGHSACGERLSPPGAVGARTADAGRSCEAAVVLSRCGLLPEPLGDSPPGWEKVGEVGWRGSTVC